MASRFDSATLNTFPMFMNMTDNVAVYANFTRHWQTVVHNTSLREDCITIAFSEMEFLPWDNPDNIVSAEIENLFRLIKNNVLGLLFLIGGPANVVNMAVFYKQGLKDRVNLCLFSLSFADGMYLAMGMTLHGEQLAIQFTTKEKFGPITRFLTNLNLIVFLSPFNYLSMVLSAIIATERCICVFNPLKVHTLLRTRTMMVIIIVVSVIIFGLFFIVSFRYRFGCVYDPVSGAVIVTGIEGEVYKAHQDLINGLESFFFGVGLPGVVMVTVTVTTIMTIVKLRQVMSWRSETTSSISPRELALTKILVNNSIFFIVCSFPLALDRFAGIFFPEVNPGRRNQNLFFTSKWFGEMFTFINSTFNFIIFYTMGSHYRETFWALFKRNPRSHK